MLKVLMALTVATPACAQMMNQGKCYAATELEEVQAKGLITAIRLVDTPHLRMGAKWSDPPAIGQTESALDSYRNFINITFHHEEILARVMQAKRWSRDEAETNLSAARKLSILNGKANHLFIDVHSVILASKERIIYELEPDDMDSRGYITQHCVKSLRRLGTNELAPKADSERRYVAPPASMGSS